MFNKQIKLFRLFGFEINVHTSWIIIMFLVTWSLAKGVFPNYYEDFSYATYWWMGIIGALCLFMSVIVHELCHSLVAWRFGMPVRGITLFLFGGAAQIEDEPPNPRAEFLMAIAGPLASIALGGLFYLAYLTAKSSGWPLPVEGILGYLWSINLILAAFNMLPAFPLDGGRVLRAALWQAKHSLRSATRIASKIGSFIAFLIMFGGIIFLFYGAFLSGLWWLFIGMFLNTVSQASYQQLLVRRSLEGEKVRDFMIVDPVTVEPSVTIKDLVDNYIYKHHFKLFPVVENGKLLGCITTHEVKDTPREEWKQRTVGELAKPCSANNSIGPNEDAISALSIMSKNLNSRLIVLEDNRLEGIITLKDLLEFISLQLD